MEFHVAVNAQVDIALGVEQFLIVRGGYDKAVMQEEGTRGLIIGREAVAKDVGFISLAHTHAVKPDVVIHRVINECLTRRNRIAVAVQHPLVQVRFGIHVVEVLVERSEEFTVTSTAEVAFTREVRDVRALAFCADVVKARAILGVAALHGHVLAIHTGKGRHIVPASILFDAGDVACGVAVLHLAGSLTSNAADAATAMKVPQVRAVVEFGAVRHSSDAAALDDRGFGVIDVHLVPTVLEGSAIRASRDASERTRTLNGP